MEGHYDHNVVLKEVEHNKDPIALCLGDHLHFIEDLISIIINTVAQSLCPQTQTVARVVYRPMIDNIDRYEEAFSMHLECKTLQEHFRLFARCGISPENWILFYTAFVWAMKTHVPYAEDYDRTELAKKRRENAYARFIAKKVTLPAIDDIINPKKTLELPLFRIAVPRF